MAKVKVVRKRLNYPVNGSSSVKLKALVGDTQSGGGTVSWGNKHELVTPQKPTVTIQEQNPLTGINASLIMSVKDISPAHDHTSITITLTGGAAMQDYTFKEEADPGGVVIYIVIITFV